MLYQLLIAPWCFKTMGCRYVQWSHTASYPTKMESSSTPHQIHQTHTLMLITFLHPLTCCFTFHSFSSCYSFTNIAIVQYVVSFTGVEMQTIQQTLWLLSYGLNSCRSSHTITACTKYCSSTSASRSICSSKNTIVIWIESNQVRCAFWGHT
jgi:hypothetical protein